MNDLVEGLARLSSLRDRDELDFALVQLVASTLEGAASIWLVRMVGEGDDQRCLTRARLAAGQAQPERDPIWLDWTQLPKLTDHPHFQTAIKGLQPVYTLDGPFNHIYPVASSAGIDGLLDVQTDKPLPATTQELLRSVVANYQNLLGLLDYGEKDALTELLNRKTFDGAFFKATTDKEPEPTEVTEERRVRHDTGSYWLAVLDIDHFKRVNDNFGHLIGDEVLLLMARLMRGNFRFHDQLYRFGGEEFVILMRCAGLEDAQQALERLRTRVQEYGFPQVGTITVSIGFTVLLDNDTPSGAFGRADKAVYHAKSHGRNQVCSYQALVQSGDLVEQVAEDMDIDLF